jgi:hypothetical protein
MFILAGVAPVDFTIQAGVAPAAVVVVVVIQVCIEAVRLWVLWLVVVVVVARAQRLPVVPVELVVEQPVLPGLQSAMVVVVALAPRPLAELVGRVVETLVRPVRH